MINFIAGVFIGALVTIVTLALFSANHYDD